MHLSIVKGLYQSQNKIGSVLTHLVILIVHALVIWASNSDQKRRGLDGVEIMKSIKICVPVSLLVVRNVRGLDHIIVNLRRERAKGCAVCCNKTAPDNRHSHEAIRASQGTGSVLKPIICTGTTSFLFLCFSLPQLRSRPTLACKLNE